MHELSIAVSIVDALREEIPAPGASVTKVTVRIGSLSGVVPEALLFCWEAATDGSPLAGAQLEIDHVSAAVWCPQCAAERIIEDFPLLRCPVCDGAASLVRGRELEIASMEILESGG